ncbi:hypothetical protein [Auraticoccus monumenti]|uniref:hypothetical protein n=1 Tax=Auraticoccus monumenti TaxID=675864 RepID=UPI0012FA711A|nr:hypothetical protein [Auraticoccus monumenti]
MAERPVRWPVKLTGRTATEWLEQHRAFTADLHPAFPATWTIRTPDGAARDLQVRLNADGWSSPYDPLVQLKQRFDLELLGDDFWLGELVERGWGATGYQGPWFLGPGEGGVVRLAQGQTMGSARVTNPGDDEAWVTWPITGPCTSWTVGVAGRTVTSTKTLLEGETRRLVTASGTLKLLTESGEDVSSAEVAAADWAPIPAGEDVRLTVAMVGTGSIYATFRPPYLRAY